MTGGGRDDVALASRGDAEAQGRVWRAHRRWVAAIVLAHGVLGQDVEDVLQEVALAFVRHVGTLRDAGAFRGWLRTLAVHAASANRTRQQRRARVELPVGDDEALAAGGAEPSPGHPALERVLAVLAGMPPEYREPMWLRAAQGLSQRQIAATLGLPETTVETRLARGRRMLRAACPDPAEPRPVLPRPAPDPSSP